MERTDWHEDTSIGGFAETMARRARTETGRARPKQKKENIVNEEQIRKAIEENNFFSLESLRAWALLAQEIRAIKDVDARRRLTREYEAQFGRKVSVWARIPDRFFIDGPNVRTPNGFLALSYLCQLPENKCAELFAAHIDHIDEPNAHLLVLQDVNDAKRRRKRANKLPIKKMLDVIEAARAFRDGVPNGARVLSAALDALDAALKEGE